MVVGPLLIVFAFRFAPHPWILPVGLVAAIFITVLFLWVDRREKHMRHNGVVLFIAGLLLVPNGVALVLRCTVPRTGMCRIYSAGHEPGIVLSLVGVGLLVVGLWILSRSLDYSALRSGSGGKDRQSIMASTPGRVQVAGLLLLLASASVILVPVPERVHEFRDFDFNPDNPVCRISPSFFASKGEIADPTFTVYFVANGSLHWSRAGVGGVVLGSEAERGSCHGALSWNYIPEDGTYAVRVWRLYDSYPWPNYTMVVDGTVTIHSPDAYLVPQIAVAAVGVGLVSLSTVWRGRPKPEEPPEA